MNNPNNSGLNLDLNFNEYRGFAASMNSGTVPTAAARSRHYSVNRDPAVVYDRDQDHCLLLVSVG